MLVVKLSARRIAASATSAENASVESSSEPLVASEADIAALEQLRHCDRVATLGRMTASVAHELANPLNVIELRAQLITSDAHTVQQARRNAEVIVEQARRMTRIIEQVLSFVSRRSIWNGCSTRSSRPSTPLEVPDSASPWRKA